jgi:hypothetical protein
MGFGAELLLLIWVVVSILASGIALLHSFTKLRGLVLIGYGAAAVKESQIQSKELGDSGRSRSALGLCCAPYCTHAGERSLLPR